MKDMIRILYKDDMLAVAVKPAGVLSQPDRTGEDSMITLLKAQLGREVFPVHRLDRAVGGLMIFAMTKAAAGKLSALLIISPSGPYRHRPGVAFLGSRSLL